MTYPVAKETVRDFGTGISAAAVLTQILYGVTSLGAKNELAFYSSPSVLRDERGEGPAVEALANVLAKGGGPVGLISADPTIAASNGDVLGYYGSAGTIGSVTNSGGGPTVTLTGASTLHGTYQIRIEITLAGALNVGKFRWSKDNGATWVESNITLPSGGTYALGQTGLTANFTAGSYVLNATYNATATAAGAIVAISGDATIDALVRIEIVTGGALGTARFRYCLDGYAGDKESERTYSEVLTVPSGGTFVIPYLGNTVTFTGSSVAGDYYLCDVKCAAWNAADLAEAFEVLRVSPAAWRALTPITSKGNGDATAHALLTAALNSGLQTFAASSKYRRGMISADRGDSPSSVVTAYQNTTAIRCLVAHGEVRRVSAKPFPGYGFPVTSCIDVIAARAANSLLSTDLKRVKSGALDEVIKLFHDEYRNPSQLDDVKITTLRTYDEVEGYFIGQGRLKSPSGSDFKYWPHGLIIDVACEIIHKVLTEEIGAGLRFENRIINGQKYLGTLDSRDAYNLEVEANSRLAAQLLSPENAEGTPGHVTGIRYEVNQTHNFQKTGIILGDIYVQSLVYVDGASTSVGFVVELPQ